MSSTQEELFFKQMKESIGQKDPIVFFEALSGVIEGMVKRLTDIEKRLEIISIQTSLGVHWDGKIASNLLVREISKMRENKDAFAAELTVFKEAYAKGEVVKDYETFVKFWSDTLGWHPFIDAA